MGHLKIIIIYCHSPSYYFNLLLIISVTFQRFTDEAKTWATKRSFKEFKVANKMPREGAWKFLSKELFIAVLLRCIGFLSLFTQHLCTIFLVFKEFGQFLCAWKRDSSNLSYNVIGKKIKKRTFTCFFLCRH